MNLALFPDVVVNGETIPSARLLPRPRTHRVSLKLGVPQGKARHRLAQWRRQALTIRALRCRRRRAAG